MEIDVRQVLYGIDGEALTEPGKNGIEEITLKKVMCGALMAPAQTATGEQKAEAWNLAFRIQAADKMPLTVDEIAMIKKKIGETFNAIVVGPAWLILDPVAMSAAEQKAEEGKD